MRIDWLREENGHGVRQSTTEPAPPGSSETAPSQPGRSEPTRPPSPGQAPMFKRRNVASQAKEELAAGESKDKIAYGYDAANTRALGRVADLVSR